ncbi:MAG: alginate lyase family protein, partial [Pseudomonadota bacterium]
MNTDNIDWSAPGPGPENQLWRMNLHYMEYLEGVEDGLWARLVSQWIDANGLGGPGAWRDSWNSYALSLRAVVWMQELARRRSSLPQTVIERVERNLIQQISFLEENLETDLGGNHLIKNIKALIWAGAFFDGPDAERWRTKGVSLLSKELDKQILADGMHYERSPSYHCQVFADLLECRHALGGDKFGGKLDDVLRRMAQVILDLTHTDGGTAQFNDAGLSMAYSPADCLAAYEALGFDAPTARNSFSLPDAGYFGLRTPQTYFVGDCGLIAPDDLPAHGHGDILSFEWSVGGQRIIVDQGVFEYVEGSHRQQSRSAANHNTLCIEGADQAEFFGAFRCGRRPSPDCLRYDVTEKGMIFEGQHDGYANLKNRPIHRRKFDVSADQLTIVDSLTTTAPSPASIGFLLHPDVAIENVEHICHLISGDMRISVEASLP